MLAKAPRRRRAGLLLAGVALAAVPVAGCGASDDTTAVPAGGGPTSPTGTARGHEHNAADVSFATGMIAHHEQAVVMADIVLGKAPLDPDVAALARRIKAAQQPEIAQLRGWLRGWGEPVPTAGSGSGHAGHGGHAGTGPGMVSALDLTSLAEASGGGRERMFLQLMTRHHEGAIAMAREEVADGRDPAATALAAKIVKEQTAEVARMREMLAKP